MRVIIVNAFGQNVIQMTIILSWRPDLRNSIDVLNRSVKRITSCLSVLITVELLVFALFLLAAVVKNT